MSIRVTFLVDGQAVLGASWSDVPRIGEDVDIATTNPLQPKVMRVCGVKWSVVGGEPRVDIELRKVK